MIDFATALAWLELDDEVTVSTGTAEPDLHGSPEWSQWRSSNFTGRLVEKTEDTLRFEVEILQRDDEGAEMAEEVLSLSVFGIQAGGGHVFTPSDPSMAVLRAIKREVIDAEAEAHATAPFEWDFGETDMKDDDGNSLGPAGVQTLQVRGMIDEKNWLGAHAGALTAIIAGYSGAICPLKTTANVWVQTTASDVVKVLAAGIPGVKLSLLGRQEANLARHGALKKACADAVDAATLGVIDPAQGWP